MRIRQIAMDAPSNMVAHRFFRLFGISPHQPRQQLLEDILAAFARLPYENLTKIIAKEDRSTPRAARRLPDEVLRDHQKWGAGGTCFSLTETLATILRQLGWEAQPILADRTYGPATHSALLIWLDDQPHLVDPGYLIVRPIPIAHLDSLTLHTSFNTLVLQRSPNGTGIELYTQERDRRKYRLTFRTTPADQGEFLRAWDASFDWDMMRYPLLTRVCGSKQVYLRGNRLQWRSHDRLEHEHVPVDMLAEQASAAFGIDPQLVRRAMTLLGRKSSNHSS